MAESHIDTRTPEEMYWQAYNRITSIADSILAVLSKPTYSTDFYYVFPWDLNSQFSYTGKNKEGLFTFVRAKDFKEIQLSQYNTLSPVANRIVWE
jgi:hypothetical protein